MIKIIKNSTIKIAAYLLLTLLIGKSTLASDSISEKGQQTCWFSGNTRNFITCTLSAAAFIGLEAYLAWNPTEDEIYDSQQLFEESALTPFLETAQLPLAILALHNGAEFIQGMIQSLYKNNTETFEEYNKRQKKSKKKSRGSPYKSPEELYLEFTRAVGLIKHSSVICVNFLYFMNTSFSLNDPISLLVIRTILLLSTRNATKELTYSIKSGKARTNAPLYDCLNVMVLRLALDPFLSQFSEMRPIAIRTTDELGELAYIHAAREIKPIWSVFVSTIPLSMLIKTLIEMTHNGFDYVLGQRIEIKMDELSQTIIVDNKRHKFKRLSNASKMSNNELENIENESAHFSSASVEIEPELKHIKIKTRKSAKPKNSSKFNKGKDIDKELKPVRFVLDQERKELLALIREYKLLNSVKYTEIMNLVNRAKALHTNIIQKNSAGNKVTIKWIREDGTERSVVYETNHAQRNESSSTLKGFKLKRIISAAEILVIDGLPVDFLRNYLQKEAHRFFNLPAFLTHVLFERRSK